MDRGLGWIGIARARKGVGVRQGLGRRALSEAFTSLMGSNDRAHWCTAQAAAAEILSLLAVEHGTGFCFLPAPPPVGAGRAPHC